MNVYETKWEYKTTYQNHSCLTMHMNEMGAERWEIVSLLPRKHFPVNDDWSEITIVWKRAVIPRHISHPQEVFNEIVAEIEGTNLETHPSKKDREELQEEPSPV